MSSIKKVENLKQAHLDYILLCIAKTSDVDEIKTCFQSFFETGISGEVIMHVLEDKKDLLPQLRESISFDEKTKGIRIADPVQQLELLDKLHDDCLVERVVNVTREGNEITKIDHPTALRCIEVANRIRSSERGFELEREKLRILALQHGEDIPDLPGDTTDVEGTPVRKGPAINIIHKKNEKEEA